VEAVVPDVAVVALVVVDEVVGAVVVATGAQAENIRHPSKQTRHKRNVFLVFIGFLLWNYLILNKATRYLL
jgi:phosphatidylglycerophosphatase A